MCMVGTALEEVVIVGVPILVLYDLRNMHLKSSDDVIADVNCC